MRQCFDRYNGCKSCNLVITTHTRCSAFWVWVKPFSGVTHHQEPEEARCGDGCVGDVDRVFCPVLHHGTTLETRAPQRGFKARCRTASQAGTVPRRWPMPRALEPGFDPKSLTLKPQIKTQGQQKRLPLLVTFSVTLLTITRDFRYGLGSPKRYRQFLGLVRLTLGVGEWSRQRLQRSSRR